MAKRMAKTTKAFWGACALLVLGAGMAQAGGEQLRPSRRTVSADGRYKVFATTEALVTADTNQVADIYLRDLKTLKDELVSVASDGSIAQGIRYEPTGGVHDPRKVSFAPAISRDARVVSFMSYAFNLVPGDTLGAELYVHDRKTGETRLCQTSRQECMVRR